MIHTTLLVWCLLVLPCLGASPRRLLLQAEVQGPQQEQPASAESSQPDANCGKDCEGGKGNEIESFLLNHIANPGPGVCGHWQHTHKTIHQVLRNASNRDCSLKYVTYYNPMTLDGRFTKPGLGDMLNGMVSAFLVALLTDRAFVMEESPLTELVEPSEIDWRIREDVPRKDSSPPCTVAEVSLPNSGKSSPDGWKDSVLFPEDIRDYFQQYKDAANIRIATNGGVISRIFRHRQDPSSTADALHILGMRHPTAFGCIVRYLIRPKEEVWRLALKPLAELRQPKSTSVCLHMRTSDGFAFYKGYGMALENVLAAAQRTVINCAEKTERHLVPEDTKARWLFLSDSSQLRESVASVYKGKVVDTGITPFHIQQVTSEGLDARSGLASVLAEWLVFSTCDYYTMTESGYSKTSYAYNLSPKLVHLFSHYQFGGAKGECDQSRPNGILDFWRWSGV